MNLPLNPTANKSLIGEYKFKAVFTKDYNTMFFTVFDKFADIAVNKFGVRQNKIENLYNTTLYNKMYPTDESGNYELFTSGGNGVNVIEYKYFRETGIKTAVDVYKKSGNITDIYPYVELVSLDEEQDNHPNIDIIKEMCLMEMIVNYNDTLIIHNQCFTFTVFDINNMDQYDYEYYPIKFDTIELRDDMGELIKTIEGVMNTKTTHSYKDKPSYLSFSGMNKPTAALLSSFQFEVQPFNKKYPRFMCNKAKNNTPSMLHNDNVFVSIKYDGMCIIPSNKISTQTYLGVMSRLQQFKSNDRPFEYITTLVNVYSDKQKDTYWDFIMTANNIKPNASQLKQVRKKTKQALIEFGNKPVINAYKYDYGDIFTIDPVGTTTQDMAISIKSGYIYVFIINTPYILHTLGLMDCVTTVPTTMYTGYKKYGLLPNELTNNGLCSLVENTERSCIVCKYDLQSQKLNDIYMDNYVNISKNLYFRNNVPISQLENSVGQNITIVDKQNNPLTNMQLAQLLHQDFDGNHYAYLNEYTMFEQLAKKSLHSKLQSGVTVNGDIYHYIYSIYNSDHKNKTTNIMNHIYEKDDDVDNIAYKENNTNYTDLINHNYNYGLNMISINKQLTDIIDRDPNLSFGYHLSAPSRRLFDMYNISILTLLLLSDDITDTMYTQFYASFKKSIFNQMGTNKRYCYNLEQRLKTCNNVSKYLKMYYTYIIHKELQGSILVNPERKTFKLKGYILNSYSSEHTSIIYTVYLPLFRQTIYVKTSTLKSRSIYDTNQYCNVDIVYDLNSPNGTQLRSSVNAPKETVGIHDEIKELTEKVTTYDLCNNMFKYLRLPYSINDDEEDDCY